MATTTAKEEEDEKEKEIFNEKMIEYPIIKCIFYRFV